MKTASPSVGSDDPQIRQLQEELNLSLKNLTQSEKKFWEVFAQQ